MRPWFLPLCLPLLVLAPPAEAASLRCGTELASEGATKADVLLKCGQPMMRDTREVKVKVKNRDRSGEDGDETSQSVTVTRVIDLWIYNFGPNRFMQIVEFENGVLVDVRSGGYGR
jgi:hypothetical protein